MLSYDLREVDNHELSKWDLDERPDQKFESGNAEWSAFIIGTIVTICSYFETRFKLRHGKIYDLMSIVCMLQRYAAREDIDDIDNRC